ncbi:MAG: hypothetical protein LBH59_10355 [Planctomycetaceae bacterium]|nr:hypothetical protein [Planctomycetaceae bacterium]
MSCAILNSYSVVILVQRLTQPLPSLIGVPVSIPKPVWAVGFGIFIFFVLLYIYFR